MAYTREPVFSLWESIPLHGDVFLSVDPRKGFVAGYVFGFLWPLTWEICLLLNIALILKYRATYPLLFLFIISLMFKLPYISVICEITCYLLFYN